jgi:hypothetical protein
MTFLRNMTLPAFPLKIGVADSTERSVTFYQPINFIFTTVRNSNPIQRFYV